MLDAARDLFAERGYETTTVRMIAERAQLSPAGLFTTFTDKADILHHVRMAQNAELRAELDRAFRELEGSAADRFCTLVRLMYEREWPYRALVLAWIGAGYSWSAETESSARSEYSGMFDGYRRLLQEGVRSGEFRPDLDVELAVEMVWGVYLGNWRHTLHGGCDLRETQERTERKLRLVFEGFAAPTAD